MPAQSDNPAHAPVVVIGKRTLMAEALASCIGAEIGHPVLSFPDLESWEQSGSQASSALVLLDLSGSDQDGSDEAVMRVKKSGSAAPIIVLSDSEEVEQIVHMLRSGARGYVPTNTPLGIAMKAIRLVLAGGVFIPTETVLADQSPPKAAFTARQQAVMDALQQGKSNKVIAHELNMSESTVKSHIRNIMKQLEAKNRTEAAIKIRAMALPKSEPT